MEEKRKPSEDELRELRLSYWQFLLIVGWVEACQVSKD
jgi:hypothetical protein